MPETLNKKMPGRGKSKEAPARHSFLRQYFSARDDADQYHDNRCHKENVNEPPHGVRTHQAQGPENQKHYRDGPQRDGLLSLQRVERRLSLSIDEKKSNSLLSDDATTRPGLP